MDESIEMEFYWNGIKTEQQKWKWKPEKQM